LAHVDETRGRSGDVNGSQAIVPLVELTAENLFCRRDLPTCRKAAAVGYTVMIETSGERFIGDCRGSDEDCGCEMPGFGRADTFEMRNLEHFRKMMK